MESDGGRGHYSLHLSILSGWRGSLGSNPVGSAGR